VAPLISLNRGDPGSGAGFTPLKKGIGVNVLEGCMLCAAARSALYSAYEYA
jgi:hypothetical protein